MQYALDAPSKQQRTSCFAESCCTEEHFFCKQQSVKKSYKLSQKVKKGSEIVR
jgi:hypothetical protein